MAANHRRWNSSRLVSHRQRRPRSPTATVTAAKQPRPMPRTVDACRPTASITKSRARRPPWKLGSRWTVSRPRKLPPSSRFVNIFDLVFYFGRFFVFFLTYKYNSMLIMDGFENEVRILWPLFTRSGMRFFGRSRNRTMSGNFVLTVHALQLFKGRNSVPGGYNSKSPIKKIFSLFLYKESNFF